jgi:parallel beta-helix repeat protein
MKKSIALMTLVALGLSLLAFGSMAVADDEYFFCDFTVSPGDLIQDAIDSASSGDTICVEPGTYTADLDIFKSIELLGIKGFSAESYDGENSTFHHQNNRPIIEGVATVPADQFPLAVPNIDIQADNVSIHGFVIQSPEVAEDEYSSGIVLTGKNISIYDNSFFVGTGDISQAIQTYRQTNAPEGLRDISGLHIYRNTFTHLSEATGFLAYEGIFINPQSEPIDTALASSAVVIEKNKFVGNLIRAVTTQRSATVIRKNWIMTAWIAPEPLSTFPRGIQLSQATAAGSLPEADSTHHRVTKNWINDRGGAPLYTGILVRDGVTDSAMTKNVVRGVIDDGISLGNGGAHRVIKNSVRHCGADGLDLGGDSNTVLKNSIKYSGQDGIVIQGNENIIEKNFVDVNGRDGIVILEDNNTVEKNFVRQNDRYGIFLADTSADNLLEKNKMKDSGAFDLIDEGTDNIFEKNKCDSSDPDGLCK